MKSKFVIPLIAALALVSQLCLAGSVKGKVTPGKSVVYLEAASGPVAATADKHVVMDQKGLLFQPHVLVIQQGTTVEFLNGDPVAHNVFWPSISGDKKKSHNLGTWPTGQKKPFKFEEAGVVALLCNVHPEMAGYIVVTPSPYYTETDASGAYSIANVPEGQYTLTAWHEGKKILTKKISVTGDTIADLTLQ